LEELLEASFANATAGDRAERRLLREVARRYLSEISGKPVGYLKVADTTGFSSFSFDELYAKIPDDPVLNAGPARLLASGPNGLAHMIDALAWLPELDLALGKGPGQIDTAAIGRVVDGWMSGKTISELAGEFGKMGEAATVRNAGAYVFSKLSQTISWGAHAYVKGWTLQNSAAAGRLSAQDLMLPAYIQHGVRTPEAAVAALLGVPRLLAEPIGKQYRELRGALQPKDAAALKSFVDLKSFVESAKSTTWDAAVGQSKLAGHVSGKAAMSVWKRMRGLA
jgi:helicase